MLNSIRKRKTYLEIGIAVLLLLIVITLCKHAGDDLYDYKYSKDSTRFNSSTVIVCLAGGKGRVTAAIKLYNQGVGKSLLIIGVGPQTTRESIINNLSTSIREHLTPERLANIIVENQSKNTIENARALQHLFGQTKDTQSIVLVTSGYHIKRALLILKETLPQTVSIYPYIPSDTLDMTPENWFYSFYGIKVTMIETAKLLLTSLSFSLLKTL